MVADTNSRIKKYLQDTFNIRNIMEEVPVRAPSSELTTWILAPWSLESISMNCRLPVEEVTRILESVPQVEIATQDRGANKISVVRWLGSEPFSYQAVSSLLRPGRKIRDFINLHIYNYLVGRTGTVSSPVKLEDALFDLKNSVMLPDDFMPDYLMGNLEGEDIPPSDHVMENLQPFSDRTDVYCYFEPSHKGSGSLAYLFAASPEPGMVNDNKEIEKIIGDSFRSLPRDPDYEHFELSRYMKTILFNIQRYSSGELRRPLPPPHIIESMKRKGIIAETNGKYSVSEGISAEHLEGMLETEKKAAKALSARWLESMAEPA